MKQSQIINNCLACDKYKAEQEKALKNCDSVFDAIVDIKDFEYICSQTCDKNK